MIRNKKLSKHRSDVSSANPTSQTLIQKRKNLTKKTITKDPLEILQIKKKIQNKG